MAKCVRCGRKGIFLKVNGSGLCANCQAEAALAEIEKQINNKTALLNQARAEAKTQAHAQLEAEYKRLEADMRILQEKHLEMKGKNDALAAATNDAQKNLESILRRTEKLKPVAASIKNAYQHWVGGDSPEAIVKELDNLSIEELMPTPDLKCLTVQALRSRYNALRKQIIELCADHQARYTIKANATIYKLMVLALEAELENILHKLQFGKLEGGIQAVRELTSKYYQIAADGNQNIAGTIRRFIGQIESLYLEVVAVEYEYYVQRERAKEEQRALREQMRQEAAERKQLEAERKKVENEREKYRSEIERIKDQMQRAQADELETMRARLQELEHLVCKVEERRAEIVNLQNGKAGTVYIISNIGSFGENVFKIGMTRRLEPQDRVSELSSASVPFPFDVHSFIFSEDAVSLESELHKALNAKRVNKVNLRKEFFEVSIDDLRELVNKIDPTAPFQTTALAEQFRMSQSIELVPESDEQIFDDLEDD